MPQHVLFDRELPRGWSIATVDAIKANEKSACVAGPFGSNISSKYFVEEGVPVIRGGNLTDDLTRFVPKNFVFVSPERATAYRAQHVRGDDLVFTCWGTIGQVGLIPKDGPFPEYIISNKQLKLRANTTLADPRYLFYYFASPQMVAHIRNRAIGAAVPGINLGILKALQVVLPPPSEQRRIASILSAYDDLIENNTRRIAILEEMARRIYEEWFVRFRFPGHEGVRMVESELGLVPEGWESTSLGEVAENHDRLRKPLSKMERETFKGPYPYYGAAKVFDYVREYIFDGQFLLLAEDGSVETPEGFPVLQLTDGKFWANNHTHILRGSDRASTEFLYLRLERQPIRGYITGAAQPKLTQAAINRISVVLPARNVLCGFDALVKPIFAMRAVLVRKNRNLRTTRDLLLPKLISGELDVSALPEPGAVAL